jgi:hypothetical protein
MAWTFGDTKDIALLAGKPLEKCHYEGMKRDERTILQDVLKVTCKSI